MRLVGCICSLAVILLAFYYALFHSLAGLLYVLNLPCVRYILSVSAPFPVETERGQVCCLMCYRARATTLAAHSVFYEPTECSLILGRSTCDPLEA